MPQYRSPWPFVAALGLIAATADNVGAATPEGAVSLGYPNAGRLLDGKQFRETPYLVMVPAHEHTPVRWALPALLSVIDRASRIVARKFPGSVLEIGELSRRTGGPISSHKSHQNGRDADVGFYYVDLDGELARADRFMRCNGRGEVLDDPTLRFDDKRNWAFVRALLEDPRYEVRQIFIYAPLRARLLAYAAKVHAPREIRWKAARAMMQPVNALPHDDHFHVRISCPADQVELGCEDLPLRFAPGYPYDLGGEDVAQDEPARPAPADPSSNEFPPEEWGGTSRLWSIERGLCDPQTLACVEDEGDPVCDDFGDLGVPPFPSIAETTAPPSEDEQARSYDESSLALVTAKESSDSPPAEECEPMPVESEFSAAVAALLRSSEPFRPSMIILSGGDRSWSLANNVLQSIWDAYRAHPSRTAVTLPASQAVATSGESNEVTAQAQTSAGDLAP